MTVTGEQLEVIEMRDPYTLYRQLRRKRPVARVRLPMGLPCWLVTRHDDVRAALNHPGLIKDGRRTIAALMGGRGSVVPAVHHLLNLDPPDHTRLRTLVAGAFTARATARWEPAVARAVAVGVDAMAGRETADLMADFALPVTREIICDVIGIAAEDRAAFLGWAEKAMLGNSTQAVDDCAELLKRYRRELPADPAAAPVGLVPHLLRTAGEPGRITGAELVSMAFLLLIAGWETTAAAIGNGVLTLITHPEQLAAVRAEPSRLDGVVEELLRFESPVNLATMRVSATALRLGEADVPAGELVMLALGAANRDGDRFAAGDRLDLDADPTGHLAFGHGIHRCLGAPLGRLIARRAIGELLRVFPDLRLDVAPDLIRWQPLLLRGPAELPVRPGDPRA
ncbi:cytochrome P450 [Actinoplanes sp. NPDC048796]|uniref:cytochrome P450 family protein n=1 Tax=unclassified Actinoplanes TaxID=2626549 RepID=UPI00340A52D8